MPEDENIELGEDALGETLSALETKYRDQMRQIVTQKLDLPISTLSEMIDDQINLSPDFQRRDIWNTEKRSRFIESIIMNVPVPPVFLGEDQYGSYVVLDGRQRLTAIYEFLNNHYALKGLDVWDDLNSLTYHDLEKKKLDKAVTRRFIPAVVILKESSAQVKYDVFDRLNQGGVIAEAMEIRNAVYPGEFNRLLHDLSANPTFRKLWDIPSDPELLASNALYNRMRDLELVLRFFALREYSEMNMRFKDYLSDFMDRRNERYRREPELKQNDTDVFVVAVTNCWQIFGEQAFRRPSGIKSAPLADALMLALCDLPSSEFSSTVAAKIVFAVQRLCTQNEEFIKSISYGTNGKSAIETRVAVAKTVVEHLMSQ
jgi:Protein of unknown function DUF262